MRKGRVVPGKFIEALGFATEIAGYVKKYEGISPVQVFMDSFGEMTTIRWVVDYKDLASLEKVGYQMMADQEYLEKVNRSANLFIPGSIKDVVMRSIEL